MTVVREIMVGDEVKNTNGNDVFGRVMSKYPDALAPTKILLDIRSEERIYYGSPITNWITIRAVEDIE